MLHSCNRSKYIPTAIETTGNSDWNNSWNGDKRKRTWSVTQRKCNTNTPMAMFLSTNDKISVLINSPLNSITNVNNWWKTYLNWIASTELYQWVMGKPHLRYWCIRIFNDRFFGFNTACKAAWLTRKSSRNWNVRAIANSQMLLRSIRESKKKGWNIH